ncbi:hypothetical protein GOODEAATRI_019097 [Goodea atripinnis]|uniref:Uncharacterized protein n=1 Tax=Goodea atripinnis TaxID=208336 RepID=A0ABV0NBT9_9TELE
MLTLSETWGKKKLTCYICSEHLENLLYKSLHQYGAMFELCSVYIQIEETRAVLRPAESSRVSLSVSLLDAKCGAEINLGLRCFKKGYGFYFQSRAPRSTVHSFFLTDSQPQVTLGP